MAQTLVHHGRQEFAKPFNGTVEVTRIVPGTAAQVFEALTSPDVVRQWFGDLSSPLRVGERTKLDFGDGDFFMIETKRIEPPLELEYSWRFLGTSPLDSISWSITPNGTGCTVTVRDSQDEREPEDALMLREGWRDFTLRLRRFLKTGRPSRYPWRHEFDGSIEIPSDVRTTWNRLFEPGKVDKWLPLNGPALTDGATVRLGNGCEWPAFEIARVVMEQPFQVRFEVSSPAWAQTTEATLSLSPRKEGTLLSVSHYGWQTISRRKALQKELRKQFCDFWITCLQTARLFVASESRVG